MALFQLTDLDAEALAAAMLEWGVEVLQRYGWVPRDDELVCSGCGAKGSACEIFATGRPFHPRSPSARWCPLQANRRRAYRREWTAFARRVEEACGFPLVLARLVWAFMPTFGLVLSWGHLLGPPSGRFGDHSQCSLCLRAPVWAPGFGARARLAWMIGQCQHINAAEAHYVLRAAQWRDLWFPGVCASCGRPTVTEVGQKELCRECSGRGAGLWCRCLQSISFGCPPCRRLSREVARPGLTLRAPVRPA